MQKSNVYEWRVFANFIGQKFEPGSDFISHPVLDEIALDLMTGALQRRNKNGHPIEPWQSPSDLAKSFLLPSEANARPVMGKWLLRWDPEREEQLIPEQSMPQCPTALEEYEMYGWKGALQLEEKRLRAKYKMGDLTLTNTLLSKLLSAYAKEHNIVAGRERVPDSEYIRVHVLTKKKDII